MILFFLLICFSIALGSDPSILAEIPWGTGADKIGLLDQPEIETLGPKSFTVNNGKVFILDYVDQGIKAFDLNAKTISKVGEKIVGGSIALGPDGSFLVLNGKNINKISQNGLVEDSVDISKDIDLVEGYGQDVYIKNGKSLMINNHKAKEFKIADIQSGKLLKSDAEKQSGSCKPARKDDTGDQSSYDVKWVDRSTIQLSKYNKKDELTRTIEIKTTDAFGGVQIKGVDSKGNVYLEVERMTPDNYVHLDIKKINRAGKEVSSIELINNYFTTVYKKTEIDSAGNIYQMVTDQDGVRILLWTMP
jgi:hypothetical protein